MNSTAALQPVDDAETTAVDMEVIDTRFGELTVDPTKIITFYRGLYGFEHQRRFLLTQVPDWPDFFKLLQAVDDPSLSLIVLPLEGGKGPIDQADFNEACATLDYDPAATSVIGIVTMRDDPSNQVFTINLKAPLLIDSIRREGHQHVFASEKYPLRHPLDTQTENEG